MNNMFFVHSIITTRTPDDWTYIKRYVLDKHQQKIDEYLPVFLTLKDFKIKHDPTFKAFDILSSWWQYKKIPIIVIKDMDEWHNLEQIERMMFESTSIFID